MSRKYFYDIFIRSDFELFFYAHPSLFEHYPNICLRYDENTSNPELCLLGWQMESLLGLTLFSKFCEWLEASRSKTEAKKMKRRIFHFEFLIEFFENNPELRFLSSKFMTLKKSRQKTYNGLELKKILGPDLFARFALWFEIMGDEYAQTKL